ncbi:hypothetical protein BsWGS_04374 [Bradybaena similaris]
MASYSGDDTQVDAAPEDDAASRHRSDNATTSSGQRTTNHSDRHSSISTDDEYKEYLEFIDQEIPYNIDILIISHQDDIDEARKFKKDLLAKVYYTINGIKRVPVVEIVEDIPDCFAPRILDEASKRALFIFLLATENFCASDEEDLKGYACLIESLKYKRKRYNVIPVYTTPKARRDYSPNMLLGCLRPINYYSEEFSNEVRKLLQWNKNEILLRINDLEKRKKEHFANDPERFRKLKQVKNSMFPSTESSKESKSLAEHEPHSHSPANEVTPLASAMADMRMAPEQLFSPSTSCSSQKTSLDSLSTERSMSLAQATQFHQDKKVQEYLDECNDLKVMAVKENRMSSNSTQQTRPIFHQLNSSRHLVPPSPSSSNFLTSDIVIDAAADTSVGRESSNVPWRQQPTEEAEDIYAECLCPASTRQPADGAEDGYITDSDDNDNETEPKQLY